MAAHRLARPNNLQSRCHMTNNGQPHGEGIGDDTPAAGREGPDRSVPLAILLALFVAGGVAAVAVLLKLFAAPPMPPLTEPALDAAEKRWADNGPASYDLDLEIRGVRPGVVHVEVRAGEVTAFERDGVTPRQRRTWDVWSVPGQFDMIERELDMAADPVHEMQATAETRLVLKCEFDAEHGFPRRFHRIVYGGGTEVYWHVTNFEVK